MRSTMLPSQTRSCWRWYMASSELSMTVMYSVPNWDEAAIMSATLIPPASIGSSMYVR